MKSVNWNEFKEAVRAASPIKDIVESYGVKLKKCGANYTGKCPLHNDTDPSFTVYPTQRFHCFGCGKSGDVFRFVELIEKCFFKESLFKLSRRVGLEIPTFSAEDKKRLEEEQAKQDKLERYINRCKKDLTKTHIDKLKARGLDDETIKLYRIGYDKELKRLVISVFLYAQLIYWVSWSPNRKPKYRFPEGSEKPLAGAEYLSQDNCLVVEGIFDWLSLIQAGFPAVCSLGSKPSKHQLAQLKQADSLILMLDGDASGQEAAFNLADELFPKARIATLPDGKDPNSLAVALGDDFADKIESLISEAKNLLDIHIEKLELLKTHEKNAYAEKFIFPLAARLEMLEQDRYAKILKKILDVRIKAVRNAIKKATPDKSTESKKIPEEVLRQGETAARSLMYNPLNQIAKLVRRSGVVGEDDNIKLLYLALTSRLLGKPVSLFIKGISAAGKSFIVEKVLDLFPQEAYIARTGLSPHALAYSDEDFRHRTIVIFELEGLGEEGEYFLRSLLSEGRLIYETVVSTPNGPKPKVIKKPGPTNCIMTTTRTKVHPENETRFFSLSINDTSQQTKAIMRSTAKGAQKQDYSDFQTFQTWLSTQPAKVVIPFALILSDLTDEKGVRMRRDFRALLSLIEAHALLCQPIRKKNDRGQIIATPADYAVVRKLIAPIIAQGVEAAVKEITRETVDAVAKLTKRKFHTTVKAIAKELGIDKSTASRRIKEAISAGYLINDQERKGLPAQIRLGDPMPDDIDLLPDPKLLCKGGSEESATPQHPGLDAGQEYLELLHPPSQHTDNNNNDEEQ